MGTRRETVSATLEGPSSLASLTIPQPISRSEPPLVSRPAAPAGRAQGPLRSRRRPSAPAGASPGILGPVSGATTSPASQTQRCSACPTVPCLVPSLPPWSQPRLCPLPPGPSAQPPLGLQWAPSGPSPSWGLSTPELSPLLPCSRPSVAPQHPHDTLVSDPFVLFSLVNDHSPALMSESVRYHQARPQARFSPAHPRGPIPPLSAVSFPSVATELSPQSLPPAPPAQHPDLWSKTGEHLQGQCQGRDCPPPPSLTPWMSFFAPQNVTCSLALRKLPVSQPRVSYQHLDVLSTESYDQHKANCSLLKTLTTPNCAL